ncbi:U6 snRNA-associated Sm LSm4-like [Thraustotheca clavata]|uniref:U6 snRNA-associated Sm-like protein LSm4 n=1 Tax=Thraustotheca clavata TaxID=74557 RepID=A0A1W0A614_9STRA|nr:U6 snRNA-associated Sm LSm4-like [Thraustotheca clavata]
MLPLSLLQAAQGEEMLVELKNGDTYNGVLVNCDTWMNVNLKNIICTSKDGDRFWKLTECYIRGNTIKYIGVPDKVLDQVNEEDLSKRDRNAMRGRGRGGRGGIGSRGEGRGRGGREGGRGGGRSGGRGGRGAHRGGRGTHAQ